MNGVSQFSVLNAAAQPELIESPAEFLDFKTCGNVDRGVQTLTGRISLKKSKKTLVLRDCLAEYVSKQGYNVSGDTVRMVKGGISASSRQDDSRFINAVCASDVSISTAELPSLMLPLYPASITANSDLFTSSVAQMSSFLDLMNKPRLNQQTRQDLVRLKFTLGFWLTLYLMRNWNWKGAYAFLEKFPTLADGCTEKVAKLLEDAKSVLKRELVADVSTAAAASNTECLRQLALLESQLEKETINLFTWTFLLKNFASKTDCTLLIDALQRLVLFKEAEKAKRPTVRTLPKNRKLSNARRLADSVVELDFDDDGVSESVLPFDQPCALSNDAADALPHDLAASSARKATGTHKAADVAQMTAVQLQLQDASVATLPEDLDPVAAEFSGLCALDLLPPVTPSLRCVCYVDSVDLGMVNCGDVSENGELVAFGMNSDSSVRVWPVSRNGNARKDARWSTSLRENARDAGDDADDTVSILPFFRSAQHLSLEGAGCVAKKKWPSRGWINSSGLTRKSYPGGSSVAAEKILRGHAGHIFATKFLNNVQADYLLSGSADGTVRIFDVSLSHQLCSYPVSQSQQTVWDIDIAYSSPETPEYFATASSDRNAKIFSFDRLYPLRVFSGHADSVDCVQFHPCGRYVATASVDATVRLYSLADAKQVRLFLPSSHSTASMNAVPLRSGLPVDICFSGDGKLLAVGFSESRSVFIWSVSEQSVTHCIKHDSGGPLTSLAFSPDDSFLATGSQEGTLRLWQLDSASITSPYRQFSLEKKFDLATILKLKFLPGSQLAAVVAATEITSSDSPSA